MIFALGAKGEGYYVSAKSSGIRPALLTGQLDDDFRKLALDATVAVGDELPKSNVLQSWKLMGVRMLRRAAWDPEGSAEFITGALGMGAMAGVGWPRFAGAKVAVELTPKKDEKDFTHVELVQAQRRMMSPDYYLPVSKLVKEVSFTFAAEDLPVKGHYRFEVRPVECFGKKGAPIVSSVVNVQE